MSLSNARLAAIVSFLAERYPAFERFLPADLSSRANLRKALSSLLSFYEGEGLPGDVEADIDALLQEEALSRSSVEPLTFPLASIPKTAYWKGDVRRLKVDAIAFSLHEDLSGSLVPGDASLEASIQEAVGPSFKEGLRRLKGELKGQEVRPGDVFCLRARNIPARYLIGAIVPRVEVRVTERNEKDLRTVYWKAMALAGSLKAKTLAFPALATGSHRYPYREAARVAVDAIEIYHSRHEASPFVVFVLASDKQYDSYEELLG